MKAKMWLSCALMMGVVAVYSATVRAEDPKPAAPKETKAADVKAPAAKPAGEAKPAGDAKGGDKGEMGMDPEAMKMMAPGEFHAKLKPLAGKWTYVTKWKMLPTDPWDESTGKAEFKWALGGRILLQECKNNPSEKDAMMGGPFEGFGSLGYDNMKKQYFSIWSDTMGTGFMESWGTCDDSGKTFTYSGEYDCPMSGKKEIGRSVQKIVSNDKVVFEMYGKGPDGKEFQSLEVTYTRGK